MRYTIPQGCDTMVATPTATRQGQLIFAKNSDRSWDECQPLEWHCREQHAAGATVDTQFMSLPQVKTTWRHVGSRPWWCWGYEHGFNEHQVVIGNEGLASKFEAASEPKLIGMEILRLGLERGQTARQGPLGRIPYLIPLSGPARTERIADGLHREGKDPPLLR